MSDEYKVLYPSEIDVNRISISEPVENKYGSPQMFIGYVYNDGETPKPLHVKLPKLRSVIGVSPGLNKVEKVVGKDAGGKEIKNFVEIYKIPISLNEKYDASGEVKAFINLIGKLSTKVIKHVHTYRNIFLADIDEIEGFELNQVKPFFQTPLKRSKKDMKEKKYPLTFNLNLPTTDTVDKTTFTTKFFDKNRKRIHITQETSIMDVVPKKTDLITSFTISKVWKVQKGFGITSVADQVVVFYNENKTPEDCLFSDAEIESFSKVKTGGDDVIEPLEEGEEGGEYENTNEKVENYSAPDEEIVDEEEVEGEEVEEEGIVEGEFADDEVADFEDEIEPEPVIEPPKPQSRKVTSAKQVPAKPARGATRGKK